MYTENNFENSSKQQKHQQSVEYESSEYLIYYFIGILTILEIIGYLYLDYFFKNMLQFYPSAEQNGPDFTTAWKCSLYYLGANVSPPIIHKQQLWRLIASNFLHQNTTHLL